MRSNRSNLLNCVTYSSSLSSGQLQLDSILQSFSEGASDWHSLVAMTAGSFAYRLTKLGVIGSSLGRSLPFASRILSPVLGLGAEVTTYRSALSLFNSDVHTDSKAWFTDFVNFASLKIFGRISRGHNLFISHALQDVGMVAGHHLAYGFNLASQPEGSLIQQLAHAEMTNLQISAGMSLLHWTSGGRIQVAERAFELRIEANSSALKFAHGFTARIPRLLERMSFVRPEEISPLNVRDYQEEAIEALSTLPAQERDRGLVVLPTGTGKTVLFSEFVGRFSRRFSHSNVLVITHREEIIDQNANWLRKALGPTNVGILQGARKETGRHVTVASIQSLLQSSIDLSCFDLVILDEAHHYVHGNEWFRPLQQMGFFNAEGEITFNPGKLLVGVTATPDRLSGNPLNTTFGPDGLVYGKDITHFIGRRDPVTGELYLLHPYGIEVNLQMEGIEDASIAIRRVEASEKARIISEIFQDRLREGERYKKSIVFVSNKDEVSETALALRLKGLRVFALTEDIPDTVRDVGVAAYKRGEYDALVSIKIPTEGFDDPGTEAVVLGIATDSRALLVQMVGRVLRPDPLHPERKEALILDLGANLRRHHIGISAQELYNVILGPKGKAPKIEKGYVPRAQGGEIEDVEIRDLGNLFRRHAFSHVLRELLPLDEVPALAYRTNKPSDVFFNYLNALDLPSSGREVQEIAALLNDTQNRLVDAWSWDKVTEMEGIQALDSSLSPEVRRLAERFRWAIWRNFNGGITVAVPSHNSPLRDLWLRGDLPLHNQPRLPLVDFYNQMKEILVGEQAMAVPLVEQMQEAAIRAQRNWERVSMGSTSAEEILLSWTRDEIIARHKGEVPMSGEGAILQTSTLRPYFDRGEIPFAGDLASFWEQLITFVGQGSPSKELRACLLIHEVMRNYNGWNQKFPEASEEVMELHSWFIESVLSRRYGILNQARGVSYELIGKIRHFANTRELPDPRSRDRMAIFYEALLMFAAEGENSNLREGKQLIQKVLRSQLGWNLAPDHLTPHTQEILERFRRKSLENYYGQWPRVGNEGIPPRHPLLRFLENGENLNIAEYREELIARLKSGESDDLEKVINRAIWEQQRWNPDLMPHVSIQELHSWVRENIIPRFKGNSKTLGRPLRRFLETGELPERMQGEFLMADFYAELLQWTAGDDAAKRLEGTRLVYAAIRSQRGWDQAVVGAPPAAQAVMDRFFDIVVEKYWGSVTQNNEEIQRGGRLRKLLDSYQWPEYKGTAATHNWRSFAEELKTFFRSNGMSSADVDVLVDATIP